jgi:hypothetical protein
MTNWKRAQPLRRRGDRITRREFILVAGDALMTPCVLLAQQKGMPVIGFLSSASLLMTGGRGEARGRGSISYPARSIRPRGR